MATAKKVDLDELRDLGVKLTMSLAIKAKCHDCMNWTIGEVHRCTVVTCPLWLYRPKSRVKSVGM